MAFSSETIGRLLASGRNYASLIVGFVGGVGVVSVSQQKGLTDALNEIFNGVSQVVHGATSLWQILVVAFPIVGIAMAKLASRSAKTTNQAASVKAAVEDPNTPIPPKVAEDIKAAAAQV